MQKRLSTTLILLLFSISFAIAAPNEWTAITGSEASQVNPCPSGSCDWLCADNGCAGWFRGITAFSGGVYDSQGEQLLVWGGGHGDYFGNEIIAFDVNTHSWSRLTEPSRDIYYDQSYSYNSDSFAPGAAQPAARHTYDMLVYHPTRHEMIVVTGGALSGSGGGGDTLIHCFDLSTNTWNVECFSEAPERMNAAVDANGDIWGEHVFDNNGVYHLDISTNTWTTYRPNPQDGYSQRDRTLTADKQRGILYMFWGSELQSFDTNNPNAGWVAVATTGATEIEAGVGQSGWSFDDFGIMYLEEYDKLAVIDSVNAPDDIYFLDLETMVWTKYTAGGSGPATRTGGSAYGRMQYVPHQDRIYFMRGIEDPVYYYELPSEISNPTPLDLALAQMQPGEWYEFPSSDMEQVDPCSTNDCDYTGTMGQGAVMGAWSGGAADLINNRLVIWGGGHNAYGGNEVYYFDLDDGAWTRASEPTTNPAPQDVEYGYDNAAGENRPVSRHTYSSLQMVEIEPGNPHLCAVGGEGSFADPTVTMDHLDCYDFQDDTWKNLGTVPTTGNKISTAVDANGDLWANRNRYPANLAKYDVSEGTWTIGNVNAGMNWEYPTGVFDSDNNEIYLIGGGDVHRWDLDASINQEPQLLTTTGETSILSSVPGADYDPVSKRIIAYDGGSDLYALDLTTLVWTKIATTGSLPGTERGSGGLYGRFRYFPKYNGFAAAITNTDNVYFVKNPSGAQTCTPTNGGTEICDGLDNDCDGDFDEGGVCDVCTNGATQPCGSNIGQCSQGTQTCSGGQWASCSGETLPTTETCNQLDDNCDGLVDEGLQCGITFNPNPSTCAGDFNEDGIKNMQDMYLLAQAWNTLSAGDKLDKAWDILTNFASLRTGGKACNAFDAPSCQRCNLLRCDINKCSQAQTSDGGTCSYDSTRTKNSRCFDAGPQCIPTTEICNQQDDDCDGQIDEGGVCDPIPVPETGNFLGQFTEGEGGASRDYYIQDGNLEWENRNGDYTDANGIAQGSTPYATADVLQDSTGWIDLDVTTIVASWMDETYINKGFYILSSSAWDIDYRSKEHAEDSTHPELVLTTTTGTTTLNPVADVCFDASTTRSDTCEPGLLSSDSSNPTLIRFYTDNQNGEQLVSATLRLYVETAPRDATVQVYQLSHKGHYTAQTEQKGLSQNYPNDANIESDPAVYFFDDFEAADWRDGYTYGTYYNDCSVSPCTIRESEKLQQISSPEGSFTPLQGTALKILFPTGDLTGMNVGWRFEDEIGIQVEEAYFRYYLLLDQDWVDSPIEGGKLPGFSGTYSVAGWGGRKSDGYNGWSTRGLFWTPIIGGPMHEWTPIGNYFYHADMQGWFGDNLVWKNNYLGMIKPGQWYCIEHHVKMNDVGPTKTEVDAVRNGQLHTWVNEIQQLDINDARFRYTDVRPDGEPGVFGIEQVWLNFYHGGVTPVDDEMIAYIDNFVVSDSYIGCM